MELLLEAVGCVSPPPMRFVDSALFDYDPLPGGGADVAGTSVHRRGKLWMYHVLNRYDSWREGLGKAKIWPADDEEIVRYMKMLEEFGVSVADRSDILAAIDYRCTHPFVPIDSPLKKPEREKERPPVLHISPAHRPHSSLSLMPVQYVSLPPADNSHRAASGHHQLHHATHFGDANDENIPNGGQIWSEMTKRKNSKKRTIMQQQQAGDVPPTPGDDSAIFAAAGPSLKISPPKKKKKLSVDEDLSDNAAGAEGNNDDDSDKRGKVITAETARNYRTYLNRFSRWRQDLGFPECWPPTEEQVVRYKAYLAGQTKMTTATQRNYVGAINFKIKNPEFL